MENLSLDTTKETSSIGMSSRRHTVSIHHDDNSEPFTNVPPQTQATIEKVAVIVNRMGGKVKTHIQDNGGNPS
jgi:hypothetical protein